MPFDVKLPDIGEGVAEGEVVRWLVRPGERVREDQPLVEVMTDKASVEIPSPRAGVIAGLHASEGQVVAVGSVLVSIALEGEAASAVAAGGSAPAATTGDLGAAQAPPAAGNDAGVDADAMRWNNEGGAVPAVAATHAVASRSAAGDVAASAAPASGAAPARIQATPAVRQLAKQLGVALERAAGTGPGGAITADDVRRAAAEPSAPPSGTAPATPSPAPAGPEERIPLRGLRRRIAEHMRHSIATAAHYTFVAECDFTELIAHRDGLRARTEAAGVKLTYLPYVVKAMVAILRKHPMLNASLDEARGEIVIRRYYHVGVATHTAEGLTVPVLRDADRMSLFALAREIDRLAQAARAGKLKLEEVQGGTITVTSTGSRGGVLATPILYHPQVAILGVHEISSKPAVRKGQIVIRELGNLSLSLDHRVVDGAVGAAFLYDLIERLETPAAWLSEQEIE